MHFEIKRLVSLHQHKRSAILLLGQVCSHALHAASGFSPNMRVHAYVHPHGLANEPIRARRRHTTSPEIVIPNPIPLPAIGLSLILVRLCALMQLLFDRKPLVVMVILVNIVALSSWHTKSYN